MNGLSGIPEIEQNYEIGETLGEGGYGVVVKAYHKRLRKDVVIKESKLVVSEDKARAEVDILKNLHHPNLPQVFDFFIYKDKSYTVMDFIDGKSVGNLLKQPGFRFTTKEIYNYSRQLLNALDYLHSRPVPIIHGDIKPDNVMITREGNLYLIDFNISSVSDGNTAYTYGYTHGYGAPEQEAAFKEIVEKLRTPGIINTSSRSMRSSGVNGAAPSPNKRASTSSDQSADATEAYIEDPDITAEYTESMDSASQADRQDTGNVSGSEAADRKYIISAAAAAQPANLKIPITMRSDVYSAGATIYRMYIGKVYSSENGTTIVSGNVSEAFINFLNKALQQNPAKRYASGSKMLEALKQVYKKDKEYRKLCIRTVVARLIIIAALAAGIICIRHGRILKTQERETEYNSIVNEMTAEREKISSAGIPENSPAYVAGSDPAIDASAAAIEKLYDSATELFENRPEAYYQKALSQNMSQKLSAFLCFTVQDP